MADSWSVGNYSDLINNLNTQIAAGPPKLDFSNLTNAPDAYWSGQKARYEQNQRDIFKDGLPKDASGNINWNAVSEQLAKVGGAGQLQNVIGLQNLQLSRDIAGQIGGDNGSGVFSPPGVSAPPSSATSIPNRAPTLGPRSDADTGGTPAAPGQNITGPGTTVTGVDYGPVQTGATAGNITPRMIAQRTGGDPALYAQALGVSPDQVIDSNDPQVRMKVAMLARGGGTATDAPQPGAQQPQPQPQQAQQPQGQPRPVQVAQAQPQQPQSAPQGNINEATANAYESRAREAYRQGTLMSLNPTTAAAGQRMQSYAEQLFGQAKIIRDALAKNAETTPEQKNAAASAPGMTPIGFEGQKETQKQDIDAFNKENLGIQELGRSAYNGLQKAQLAKNLTLDPNFYSGPLNQYSQTYNQFKSIFGSNPASALPQEAFNKAVNDMLQEQVRSMGKSGVGRVLQSEVNIMRQSIASQGITATSNRALLEIVSRVYKQNQDIAGLTQNLQGQTQPGQLVPSLNKAVNGYLKEHPLFTDQEKQHPAILGAPDAPPQSAQWSPQQKQQWARGVGLKSGDPIRFNGQVVTVP